MFQLDLATYHIGPQCGMRRPTFTFGGGESPYYGGKSRRSNTPEQNTGSSNSGPSPVPSGIITGCPAKQTPNDHEKIIKASSAQTDATSSSTSLASVTSPTSASSSSSSASVTSVCDALNSKNKFYNILNGGGGGVMLVPAPVVFVASEETQKPRKRKERQDSGSSITQERKLVRSNSEERPVEEQPVPAADIRRVVSSEDFLPLHEVNSTTRRHHAPPTHHGGHSGHSGHTGHGGHSGHANHAGQHQPVARDSSPIKHGGKAFSEEFPRCDFLQKYRKNDSSPARSRLNDFSQKLRASPDRSNYCEEGEHERRRHTERFSRARVPTGSRKAGSGLKTRRMQRTPRQTSSAQDENENPQPIVQQHQDPIQKEVESVRNIVPEHTPFPWTEPCDSHPVPSPHAENFRTRKCNSNDNNAQFDADQQVQPATNIRLKKSDESHDVVRMTECHARKYEYHSKALFETNSNKSNNQVSEKVEPSTCFTAPEERLKQISRKLAGLKKRIAKYEENFENQNGYRISQVDKMADKGMKKIYAEIQKLRKEKMRLKVDPVSAMMNYNKEILMRMEDVTEDDVLKNKLEKIKHTLVEIENRLQEKREKCNRSTDLEQMSSLQLADEKVALQKALLYLEAQFGRPSTRDERDIAHPLYDRYRQVKRLVLRTNVSKLNSSISELETILEHETMDFVSSEMSSQVSATSLQQKTIESNIDTEDSTNRAPISISIRPDVLYTDKLISPNRSIDESPPSLNSTDSNSTSTSSVHENLHNLPLDELKIQLTATHEEKKQLRRSIKEFEHDFETKTGRRMQKDDRVDMESTYGLYKQIKAKLRLLEALVNKQKPK